MFEGPERCQDSASPPRFSEGVRRRYTTAAALLIGAVYIASQVASVEAQSFSPSPVLVADAPLNVRTAHVAVAGGTALVIWDEREGPGGIPGTGADGDIVVSRSTDGGTTWSARVAVNTDALSDSVLDDYNDVTAGPGGTWVAVWTRGTGPGVGTIMSARSSDGGLSWTSPTTVGTGIVPSIGFDGSTIVATWSRNGAPPGVDAARSTDGGATWSSPQTIASFPDISSYCSDPRVAGDGVGTWLIACALAGDATGLGEDGEIAVFRSTDNGLTWSPSILVDPEAATDLVVDRRASVASTAPGIWMTLWWRAESVSVLEDEKPVISHSIDDGLTWSQPEVIGATEGDGRRLSGFALGDGLATSGSGDWAYVWNASSAPHHTAHRLVAARSRNNGQDWVGPALQTALGAGTVSAELPGVEDLADDGSGNSYLLARDGDRFVVYRGEPGPACGDGFLDAGEQCDDGNLLDGDCCTSTCTVPACRTAENALLLVKNKDNDAGDKLLFKWIKGESTTHDEFGDGSSQSQAPLDYAFCLRDDTTGVILSETEVWSDAISGWRVLGDFAGFKYKNAPIANEGTRKIKLKPGDDGRAKAMFLAGGHFIPDEPAMPLSTPLSASLVNRATGVCWGATFGASDVVKSDEKSFKAKR
jgi:cysteine-rich repeat protein